MKFLRPTYLLLAILLPSLLHAASPVADAGADITIADFDGDESVTVVLDASATTDADGDIVSYEWTWSGGSASGEVAEGSFPATDSPVTVTLTVSDAASNVDVDTLEVSAYKKETALFIEFVDPIFYKTVMDIDLAGQSFLLGYGSVRVYRDAGSGFELTDFPPSNSDWHLIDEDTVFKYIGVRTDFGYSFEVLRYSEGVWTTTVLSYDEDPPGVAGFNNERTIEATADTVAMADYGNDDRGTDTGRVFVYDWIGDDLIFQAEILPPAGNASDENFGRFISIDDDLMAITSGDLFSVSDNDYVHLYRKVAGTWTYEATIGGAGYLLYSRNANDLLDLNSEVVIGQYREEVATSLYEYSISIHEKIGSTWVETLIPYPIEWTTSDSNFNNFVVDTDGQSFAISNGLGDSFLYQKDAVSSSWSTASITTKELTLSDLFQSSLTAFKDFEDGVLAVHDRGNGIVRLIDTNTAIIPINSEPIALAGDDINTTSFDGEAVSLFLNGDGSSDIDGKDTLSAVWEWEGGSATGLQAFAQIPPTVELITLTVTDDGGGISRDTMAVDIVAPPVISAGVDAVTVDTDGDGNLSLKINGAVLSQDNPIVSWTWRWPGGSFSGQSGTITLQAPADGEEVILEVIDSNGLSSETSFTFNLLDANPTPDIITPVNGSNFDGFGFSVAIDNATAFVGGGDGTYQLVNVNDVWQQIQLDPALASGQSYAINGNFLFAGSAFGGNVLRIYEKTGSATWTLVDTLTPPVPASGNNFGMNVATDGEYAVITSQSSAQIYRNIDGTWTFEQVLELPVGSEGTFGPEVAISGTTVAVVGGIIIDEEYFGAAYVYEKIEGVWTRVATLTNEASPRPETFLFDRFGTDIVMNDSEILVSAPFLSESSPSPYTASPVYRFSKTAGVWGPNGILFPPIPPGESSVSGGDFGSSMFLRSDILTATFNRIIYTFEYVDGDWENIGFLEIDFTVDPLLAGTVADEGTGISHDGRDLIVGFDRGEKASGLTTGKVYIYRNYAPLNPNANYEPLAEAGEDINVSDTIVRSEIDPFPITEPLGSEAVVLDASASTDSEDDIVSYEWTWASGSASGISPTARFPVGTTTVTLTVTDGFGIVNSDTVDVTVSLAQADPVALPDVSGNSLTVDLPVSGALWRLSSEFLWHADGATVNNVEADKTYQIEIIGFPGSTETISTFITTDSATTTATLNVTLPIQPTQTGTLRFPETAQGFSWRLAGESTWRNVTDNGDSVEDVLSFTVPRGPLRIEFKPVLGYATPQTRIINVGALSILLNWGEYIRINNFDSSKTFDLADLSTDPNLETPPYQYIGKIRTPLGRGSGTAVADGVVLTAAHLFFDFNGLQWSDVQWFPRQLQGTFQAAPVLPRGILYRTSYAKLVAPDSVEGEVADLPEDDQEVDFAVLYFGTSWEGGSANFLQSTAEKNWITGTESKHAVGYPQRSQSYPDKGKIFEKLFSSALTPLDSGDLPLLYETGEVFGDGGASGSALFVQPEGSTQFYPAAILLAGQGRGVYRIIDSDITRMIRDGQDAASGNDDVLDSNSSLVTYESLGGITAVGVDISPGAVLSNARWSITPNAGTGFANLSEAQAVPVNPAWDSFTISFTAVSGYATPDSIFLLPGDLTPGVTSEATAVYEPLSGFDDWLQANAIADPLDDSDGDQRAAILEYATDGQPAVVDFLEVVRVVETPAGDRAQYEVYVSSDADAILYEVKAVSSLEDVSDPAKVELLATFTRIDGPGYQTVTDSKTFTEASSRFVWVEITHDRNLATE